MSKSVSANTATHIALADTTLVTCIRVDRRDGVIQAFTEHDVPIDVDLSDGQGLITYESNAGFSGSSVRSTNTFAVDNLHAEGFLDGNAFTQDDIEAGRYDYAEIRIFKVDYTTPADGPIKIRRGFVGDVTSLEAGFEVELWGLLQRYNQEVLGRYSPDCRADLGDLPGASPSIKGCYVRTGVNALSAWAASTAYAVRPVRDASIGDVVKPASYNDRHFRCTTAGTSGAGPGDPSWNLTIGGTTNDNTVVWTTEQALTVEAVVASSASRSQFVITYTGDAPDALLKDGLVEFVDGDNIGIKQEILKWTLSSNTIDLALAIPFTIAASVNVLLHAGCEKTAAACKSFDNIFNMRAEPHVPGTKVIVRTPRAQ